MSRVAWAEASKRWLYRCDWCDLVQPWQESWVWFGSYMGADDGDVATFCCQDHGFNWERARCRSAKGEYRGTK